MPTGSCFCGNLKIEYSGEPAMTVSPSPFDPSTSDRGDRPSATVGPPCGLLRLRLMNSGSDCRHISGGSYSNNIVVPVAQFKLVSGTPKEISKTADSGKKINSAFCGDCGTTMFREAFHSGSHTSG